MRGDQRMGRFSIDYETMSNDEGTVDDLRIPVGNQVDWWIWDPNALAENSDTWIDPIYDVSNQETNQGLQWNSPIILPVIAARVQRGDNEPNERGFYTVDTMSLTVAVADLNQLIPTMITDPTDHIKDMIIFQNDVYRPTRVAPRGLYANRYAVVSIDCNQVNSEELVNYPQFQSYAN